MRYLVDDKSPAGLNTPKKLKDEIAHSLAVKMGLRK
jgi:hypothetical protein